MIIIKYGFMIFFIMFKDFIHDIANLIMAINIMAEMYNIENIQVLLNNINVIILKAQHEIRNDENTDKNIITKTLTEFDIACEKLRIEYTAGTKDIINVISLMSKTVQLYKYLYDIPIKPKEFQLFDIKQYSVDINKIICLLYITSMNYEFKYDVYEDRNTIIVNKFDMSMSHKIRNLLPKYKNLFNNKLVIESNKEYITLKLI